MEKTIAPDYSNPLAIAIRQELKHDLMKAIDQMAYDDEMHHQEGMFWLFGSSSINAYWQSGTRFPFQAKKSLDIDLSTYQLPSHVAQLNPALKKKFFAEYFKNVFDCIGVKSYNARTCEEHPYQGEGEAILEVEPDKDLVLRAIANHPELNAMSSPVPDKVTLRLDFSISPPPMLLPPKRHKLFKKNPDSQCYVDDPRNLIAKKLARCIRPENLGYHPDPTGFKPRDLLDIYNLIHATPPILNLDPQSPDCDLPIIRAITISSMVSMVKDVHNACADDFNPTPENIRTYRSNLEQILSSNFKIDDAGLHDILATTQSFINSVFPPKEGQKNLALTEDERKFVSKCYGYEFLPGGIGRRQCNDLGINPELLLSSAEAVHKCKIKDEDRKEFASRCSKLDGILSRINRILDARSNLPADF